MPDMMLVQIKFRIFDDWLRAGIAAMSFSPCVVLTDPYSAPETQSDLDLLVSLPSKYRVRIDPAQPLWVLVDEIEAIMLPTRELTEEWRAKWINLGEAWLPCEFHAEWLSSELFSATPFTTASLEPSPPETEVEHQDVIGEFGYIPPDRQPVEDGSASRKLIQVEDSDQEIVSEVVESVGEKEESSSLSESLPIDENQKQPSKVKRSRQKKVTGEKVDHPPIKTGGGEKRIDTKTKKMINNKVGDKQKPTQDQQREDGEKKQISFLNDQENYISAKKTGGKQ